MTEAELAAERKEKDELIEKYPVLEFLDGYEHLPPGAMQETFRLHSQLAFEMAKRLPRHPELSAGLRKLLEAKDCLVRAAKVLNRPDGD